jgi:hypothetical protein
VVPRCGLASALDFFRAALDFFRTLSQPFPTLAGGFFCRFL